MRRFIFALLIALPMEAWAEEPGWVVLVGADIQAALTGRVLAYDNGWQDFRVSGRTL